MRVLRNNGDGTFAVQEPFGQTARVRGFVWADLDGDGVPDAALLDAAGARPRARSTRAAAASASGRSRRRSRRPSPWPPPKSPATRSSIWWR